jgi:hypothetical protein
VLLGGPDPKRPGRQPLGRSPTEPSLYIMVIWAENTNPGLMVAFEIPILLANSSAREYHSRVPQNAEKPYPALKGETK